VSHRICVVLVKLFHSFLRASDGIFHSFFFGGRRFRKFCEAGYFLFFSFFLNGVVAIFSVTALSVSVQELQHERTRGKQIKPFQLR
jgi:hypothetical protein